MRALGIRLYLSILIAFNFRYRLVIGRSPFPNPVVGRGRVSVPLIHFQKRNRNRFHPSPTRSCDQPKVSGLGFNCCNARSENSAPPCSTANSHRRLSLLQSRCLRTPNARPPSSGNILPDGSKFLKDKDRKGTQIVSRAQQGVEGH